jgi:hypothetical protein
MKDDICLRCKHTKRTTYSSYCKKCNREYLRKYDLLPKTKVRDYIYTTTHREQDRASQSRYSSSSHGRAYRKAYYQNRMKMDTNFRLRNNFAAIISTDIREGTKSSTTTKLLGCSIAFLRKYLERQLKPGMTCHNWGIYGWHIDHIRPCASFDLSKPSEQRKCFHYTNLQPLWAKENLHKGDNYEG